MGNNNNNNHDDIYSAVIMTEAIVRVPVVKVRGLGWAQPHLLPFEPPPAIV